MINYKINPDFSKLVLEYTSGKGATIILDPVSAQNYSYNLTSLAMDGRWVFYGGLGGMNIDCSASNNAFPLGPLMAKRANLHWSTLRTRSDEYKAALVKRFTEECMHGFESGELRAVVDRVFKMSEIVQAHEYMEKNENIGKIVIQNDL